MNTQHLKNKFQELFPKGDSSDVRFFFSPGRINLIGEHTDYNGGHVFPCAITLGTYGVARKREDKMVHLHSLNFPDSGTIKFSLMELDYHSGHSWANYPKGMIRYMKEAGWVLEHGLDILIYGTIPNGAGLSSSASIEMLIGVMLNEMFRFKANQLDLVKLGKRVENEFIGVNSGIMDQFAIGMGKKQSGILLDCHTLKYEYAPINLANHQIIIMNTNKRRELADSKYNQRRSECEEALSRLQKGILVGSLGDLTEDEFEKNKFLIGDDVLEKRAEHAVYENHRTLKALQVLKKNNFVEFGQLMNRSHRSLRDLYEVTGVELDTLVEVAWEQEGTLGARMTGAGFGGCAIAFVEKDKTQEFITTVGVEYQKKIGYEAAFYVASIGDGAKEIMELAST